MEDEKSFVQSISLPLYDVKGWLKFLGVFFIVYGIILIITIVGAIIGWLPLWLGILLNKAAKGVESAHETGSADSFREALAKIKTFFTIYGILALIGLVFMVIWLIIVVATGGAIFQGLSNFY